ncbi:MAG TPA: GatB/YqeY domain-containing protein, partial [Burkholderiales bacterium]|nr:GatB/YqeY domain-containing protein [Burkholderiales bacterium]
YENAARQDLADAEKFELSVLQDYMPQQLDAAEIEAAIDEAICTTGATGAADMGKVMAALKAGIAGRADMGAVSALVKTRLSR